jgi:hypothetical protein
MNLEREKILTYKPFLYGFTATSFASMIGLGIANVSWFAIVKIPNPYLLTAFYAACGSSAATGVASGVDASLSKKKSC